MVEPDHIILKVNELDKSVAFYTGVLGFENAGVDGRFTIIRTGEKFLIQLAPWGTKRFEHYAFAVSRKEFEEIFSRVKQAGIDYGPTFDSVGANSGPGNESGGRGEAPAVYSNDPNSYLIAMRTYD